ncbi:hypothetical protein [Marinicella meishanensis]|uniref:hypothetical protein n=1 Tax=Marinicella meishanensis TaxID=2873263 RepID=UPI001CBB002A|nr:hypothetical protein [Marinicella sp. NBU2979]
MKNAASLKAALCDSGESAVDFWRIQSTGLIVQSLQQPKFEATPIVYLRRGSHVIDVGCNRSLNKCGQKLGWAYVDNAPSYEVKFADGDEVEVDCIGESGVATFNKINESNF